MQSNFLQKKLSLSDIREVLIALSDDAYLNKTISKGVLEKKLVKRTLNQYSEYLFYQLGYHYNFSGRSGSQKLPADFKIPRDLLTRLPHFFKTIREGNYLVKEKIDSALESVEEETRQESLFPHDDLMDEAVKEEFLNFIVNPTQAQHIKMTELENKKIINDYETFVKNAQEFATKHEWDEAANSYYDAVNIYYNNPTLFPDNKEFINNIMQMKYEIVRYRYLHAKALGINNFEEANKGLDYCIQVIEEFQNGDDAKNASPDINILFTELSVLTMYKKAKLLNEIAFKAYNQNDFANAVKEILKSTFTYLKISPDLVPKDYSKNLDGTITNLKIILQSTAKYIQANPEAARNIRASFLETLKSLLQENYLLIEKEEKPGLAQARYDLTKLIVKDIKEQLSPDFQNTIESALAKIAKTKKLQYANVNKVVGSPKLFDKKQPQVESIQDIKSNSNNKSRRNSN